MMSTAEQLRSYSGPAILSFGFRPFFLAGALWAALTMALWLLMLSGHLRLPTAFSQTAWHAHELIYGYVPAVIAGFLLTAIPNWTGRLPVVGNQLLLLFFFWLAGRIAIFSSFYLGFGITAVLDLSFLTVFLVVVAREIIAGNNTRNLKVLIAVVVLFVGNVVFHFEAYHQTSDGYGIRIGIAATILLIMIIGGRIIPSFTRNWLTKHSPGRLPVSFNQFDVTVIFMSSLALVSWIGAPDQKITAVLFSLACLLNTVRLARWAGERTMREPLVLILHTAYIFVPLGFALLALSIWRPNAITATGALHAWTAGAITLMTLAVMTRASLGHTGRRLTATLPIQVIYAAAILAAGARIVAAFDIWREALMYISAMAWILTFCGFVVIYGPMLGRRR